MSSPTPTPSSAAPGPTPVGGPARVASVVMSSPPPAAQPSTAAGSQFGNTFPWVLLAAIVTAAVTAWLAVWTARRKSREEERARQRTLFAEAYQAYALYKEMPYAIRRRRQDDLPGERIRLSETIREIQGKLNFYQAWITAESTTVGEAYSQLITELRKVAGGAMREAWKAPPITNDAEMNIPPTIIDLSPLTPLEETYREGVREHLDHIAPWWPKTSRGIRARRGRAAATGST